MRELKFCNLKYTDFLRAYDLSTLTPFPETITRDGVAELSGKRIYLRHDIDSNINASVAMAELENSLGIRSHYYALHYSDYWHQEGFKKLLRIQELGHEVGFHNAMISEHIVSGRKKPGDYWTRFEFYVLKSKLTRHIVDMRNAGLNVRGTCAHGHPTCITHNYSNIQLWREFNKPIHEDLAVSMGEYGLEYDCNMAFRHGYHSDSGNEWHGEPGTMAEQFRESKDFTLMINIHPQWWY